MSIGTAKPSKEEQQGIQHYFIDSHSITENITAASFAKEALLILEKEFKQHNEIILVGGSGMFIDALCFGLDNIPSNRELRDELTELVRKNGIDELLNELKSKDPAFFNIVDQKNPVRIIRAIEAIRLSGKTFTEMRQKTKMNHSFETVRFVIDLPREVLYDRINKRVDLMMKNGLLIEVKGLQDFKVFSALRTVGYSELFTYFEGKITLEEAVELIKQNSRNYAKRQLTWFRKHKDAVLIPYQDKNKMAQQIIAILNSKK